MSTVAMARVTPRPLVSVITPFFNAGGFLAEAIQSVLAQSFPDWELLLIDDGATDGTTDVALQYARSYPLQIRYLSHDGRANKGQSASRNLGLRHAAGEYIALLDHDDLWLPQKLERQVSLMESQPGTGMLYGRTLYWRSWSQRDEDVGADHAPELAVASDTIVNPPRLLLESYPLGTGAAPCTGSLMFRRATAIRIGGFEESFRGKYMLYEDQAFLTKVYLTEIVFVSGECWDWYRLHPASAMAVAVQEGQYDTARSFFLDWFEQYLIDQHVSDPQVWKALNAALRPYRHPIRERLSRVSRRLGHKISAAMHAIRRQRLAQATRDPDR
jgi:glycosyltransferase involved in cell wall biosynthesis